MKKLIIAIIFFSFGLVSGYYFIEFNYSEEEVDLKTFHQEEFVNEITAFTKGVIISTNNNQLKVDVENKGIATFGLSGNVDINQFSEGQNVKIEFVFDFEEEEFLVEKITEI
jgi:hypothetical protein